MTLSLRETKKGHKKGTDCEKTDYLCVNLLVYLVKKSRPKFLMADNFTVYKYFAITLNIPLEEEIWQDFRGPK